MSDVPTDGGVSPEPSDLPVLLVTLTDSVEGLRVDFRAERASVDRKFITAAEAVDKVNLALAKVNLALRKVKRQTVAIVAIAGVVVGVLVLAFALREHDRTVKERKETEDLVTACINGNATRAGIVNLFDVYTVTLGQLTPAATPEAQIAKDQVIGKMRSNFKAAVPPELGPRDCSVQAVTTPTTFPPSTTIAAG